MKKKLSNSLTLFYNSNFPKKLKSTSIKRYEVTIGIGGNIGNMKRRFDKLFLCLKKDMRFDLLKSSPLLLNPPFGYLNQNYFLNGIILLKTNLCPNDFLKAMQRYENKFGRKRSFQDAPRTLDIDIIFFAEKKINTKKLIIPHKGWTNRESVIIPLKYMNKFYKGRK